MKITGVQTVYLENEDLCYVRVRTDEGVTGLGETCFGPRAVAAYIHESAAPRLIGQDPLEIERHARDLPRFYIGHGGTGVSTRAHAAIDLALSAGYAAPTTGPGLGLDLQPGFASRPDARVRLTSSTG